MVLSILTGMCSRPSPGTIRTGSPAALTPTRSPVIRVIQWVAGAPEGVPAAAAAPAAGGAAAAGSAPAVPAASASAAAMTTLPGP
ncbi:hypothetical protein OG440_17910 [Streptomyces sp. NBC_00637]|uniref:hypothetical protein n=1 Tax=Streptomyces sp. NBC_00637 TaxID=2903667 RepID=UPI00324593D5